MKKFVSAFVAIIIFFAVIAAVCFAQLPSNKEQQETLKQQSGVFFSPLLQQVNISLDELNYLRRYNKSKEIYLALANNSPGPLSFVTHLSHVQQKTGNFESVSIIIDTEMQVITAEQANDPLGALRGLADRYFKDSQLFEIIARFNNLPKQYSLPKELLIPKASRYEVKPGDLLSSIAKEFYGDETRIDFLAQANAISKPYRLVGGQILFIPQLAEDGSVVSQSCQVSSSKDDLTNMAKSFYGNEAAAAGENVIAWFNSLEKSYALSEKQVLAIPLLRQLHQVQFGDTWESISKQYYDSDAGKVMLALINANNLSLGKMIFLPEIKEPKFSCVSWIKPKENNFSLGPKESKEVLFDINIPSGADIGGTYSAALILEEGNPNQDKSGVRMSIKNVYNSILILNIESRRSQEKIAELHSFEIQKKGSVLGAVFGLRNLGREQIQAQKSELRVLREDRSLAFSPCPLGKGAGVVLPEGRIELGAGLPFLPVGEYIAQATVYYGGRTPAFMETSFSIGDTQDITALTNRKRTVSILVESITGEENVIFSVDPKRNNVLAIEKIKIKSLEASVINCQVKMINLDGLDEHFSLEGLVEVKPDSFEIKPFQTAIVTLLLRDKEPQYGGRYGKIEVTAEMVDDSTSDSVIEIAPSKRFIDVCVLGANSDYQQSYSLRASIKDIVCQDGLVSAQIAFKNVGNIHFKPQGKIEILDELSQVIFSGAISLPDYLYPSQEKVFIPQIDLHDKAMQNGKEYKLQVYFEGLEEDFIESSFVFIAKERQEEQ